MDALVLDLLKTLKSLLPEARTLLVAVSGGADSVALLRLLEAGLSAENPYRLEVAHFDHALRADSAGDAHFVRDLCGTLSVPFHVERAEVARIAAAKGWNLEDAARRLRYSFLSRTAKRVGADAVVTAHTRGDQAETVLMQLLRGAAHLQGMPARRGKLVRPLLGVSRGTLRAYLAGLGQPFLEDPSNTDISRTRAWVRREVLPLLRTRRPKVAAQLSRLAELQRDQAAYFETLVQPLLERPARAGRLEMVETARLLREGPAVQRAALATLLRRAQVPPDSYHLETLRAALASKCPLRVSLPGGRTARVAYGRLELLSATTSGSTFVPQPDTGLPVEVDPHKLEAFPDVRFRTREPGDRIRLPGGSKKLAELLIDRKLPREARDTLRVLASGREVLWAQGVATDVRVARPLEHRTINPAADPDVRWMQLALERAERAAALGELPVGAVVVRAGEIIGVGHNTTESGGDPTGHAELHALRAAAQTLGDWRLSSCTLFVTLEPCPMCFGAALSAHLPRVVYGATNHREGALGGVCDLRAHSWKRALEVRGGVLAGAAREMLKDFFSVRRGGVTTPKK